MEKIYKVFSIGGNPDNNAFLSKDLSKEINLLQENNWSIERIDCNKISRAWSSNKQAYIETTQYIIIAYKGE